MMSRVGEAGAEDLRRYTESELEVINDFLTRMAEVTRDEATALRGSETPERKRPPSTPPRWAA